MLEILQENKLYLKLEKCTFEAWEVEYLGLIVGCGTMWIDPVKIKAVNKWPKPKNKKQLQRFLGFCNFYRRFIKNYSKIARPLHDLIGNKTWNWTKAQNKAMEELQKSIYNEPVLHIPIPGAPFRIEADSSDFANGAVLSQLIDNKWHPVAYCSEFLTLTEQNYSIYNKELLAIMSSLKE